MEHFWTVERKILHYSVQFKLLVYIMGRICSTHKQIKFEVLLSNYDMCMQHKQTIYENKGIFREPTRTLRLSS